MAMSTDEKIVEEALDAFEAAEEKESVNRDTARDDLKFGRLGDQWDQVDTNQRDIDGRPTLVINRLPTFIRQIVNDARLNKPSIKCHPVDDQADPETAEILNGIIRNIEVQSKADLAYDKAIDDAVSGGFGYLRVDVDYARDDTFDQDILINRIANPFTVYGDPLAQGADSAEWNTAFVTDLLTEKEFEKQYPGAEQASWEGEENDNRMGLWHDEDGVRVAEYWRRLEVMKTLLKLSDGTVMMEELFTDSQNRAIFDARGITVVADREVPTWEVEQYLMSATEILEEKTEWAGKYIPIIPCYGDEVWVEGVQYLHSLIKFAKDPQRMLNYWRTTATEIVALSPRAPWVGAVGAFNTDKNWDTANSESHATLEYDPVAGEAPPQRQPFAGVPAGALNEAMMASDDLKATLGIFDAALGAKSNETSGVAIKARDRQSDVSNFHFIDNMTRCIRHTGVVVLDLIPHVYPEPRVMRIMGEDMSTPDTVQVNQPFPDPDHRDEQDEQGDPITKIYDITTGRYDITVKAGPSFTTRREEASTQMIELLRNFPDAAPYIGDILAESLDWPRSDDIAKRLKMLLPPELREDEDGEEGNPEAEALGQKLEEGIQMFQQLQDEHGKALETIEQMKEQFANDRTLEQGKLALEGRKIDQGNEKIKVDMYKAQSERIEAEAEAIRDQAEAAKDLQEAKNAGWQMQLDLLGDNDTGVPGADNAARKPPPAASA
jgi:hypothetical protein